MAQSSSTTIDLGGLTAGEAAERLRRDGPNVLPSTKHRHPLALLMKQMVHLFAVMLWIAAVLAYLAGMPELSVAIAVVVVLNGLFAFAQEYRADRAAQKLRDLLPTKAKVRRDGLPAIVDAAELVLGDVVLLAAGDRVCADAEVVGSAGLAVDESMLTGESKPVRTILGSPVHAGTHVVEGEATAIVVTTGARTRLASIAALTGRATRPPSPLALRLNKVVHVVGLEPACSEAPVLSRTTSIGAGVYPIRANSFSRWAAPTVPVPWPLRSSTTPGR
jgi:magnesium-transporting ATPase (P-type)